MRRGLRTRSIERAAADSGPVAFALYPVPHPCRVPGSISVKLYDALEPGGLLAIQDFHFPPQADDTKRDNYAALLGIDDSTRATFETNRCFYSQMKAEFQHGVEAGEYFLFQANELENLLGTSGFTRESYHVSEASYQCFYRRN